MLIQRFPDVVSVVSECNETRETRGLYGRRAIVSNCKAVDRMGPRHGRRPIVSECNAVAWLSPASGRGQNSRHEAIAAAPTITQPLRLGATRPVVCLDRLPDAWPYLLSAGLANGRPRPYV